MKRKKRPKKEQKKKVKTKQMKKQKRVERDPDSAGQSGADQGLSNAPIADSESVEELVDEGNAFEAAAVEGVEDAKEPGVSEVHTREVPEDDVPAEYLSDEDEPFPDRKRKRH